MNIKYFLKNNWDTFLILTLYSILAIFSMKYYTHIGWDDISYINIAHGYAIGDFSNAINGYWSPLYSWLLTPFFISGFTPWYGVYASKILSLIIGFFSIISVKMLLNTLKMGKTTQRAALIALVPSVLYFALIYNTPDILTASLIIIYLSVIFKSDYSDNIVYGVLCGFIGTLAYFSKSYAFPFFLVHFILFNLIYYFKDANSLKKKSILKNLILGLSVFFVISGVWAGVISEKYDKITISTSGEYNQAMMGPSYPEHPVYFEGLFKPPNNLSNSIWGDLSYVKMRHWSPFDSWDSFKHELNNIGINIYYAVKIIESFYLVTFLVIVSIIAFILKSSAQKSVKDKLIYLMITMLIYISGYLFIILEWRYLWFIFILILISGFYLVQSIYNTKIINKNLRNILLIILIVSFAVEPTYEIILLSNPGDPFYDLSNTLKSDYGIHGNIASNKFGDTMKIAYYLNAKYYGQTKKTNNSVDLEKELESNNIDYYFFWGEESKLNLPDYYYWNEKDKIELPGYQEITNGRIKGLKIYSKIKN